MLIESEGIIERVRYMMESMKLNATAFATEASITPSVISHMLNGRNRPTIETLNNIIAAYPEWHYEWLLFGKGTPKDEIEQMKPKSLDSNLFESAYMTSSASHKSTEITPLNPTNESLETSFSELKNEIEALRLILHDVKKQERHISEIRIFYSDGSYEIFLPQE